MKVLISEDQPQLQTLMKLMMRKWGYEADIASNGLEAFNLAKENQYDVCIMDLKMPIMDGYKATKKIRNELSFLPILALTGNPVSEKEKCLKVGMDDFLKKPCNNSELRQKIAELTIKTIKLDIEHDKIKITKEMPMDSKHLQELRELDKKGLTKLTFTGSGHEFIVHKNVQNKISYDFIDQGQELSEFIDRSDDKPGLCHLYKANLLVNTRSLLPEELEERIREEDDILKKHISPVVQCH